MGEEQTATQAMQEQYEKDILFRRAIDAAVHIAMQHFDHMHSDVDKRDLHHIAVLAAREALRTAIDGDRYLKAMEFERDAAKKMLESFAPLAPTRFNIPTPPKGAGE